MKQLRKIWAYRYARRRVRKAGFWFVDIPRTSSSSIRAELGEIFGTPYAKQNLLETAYSRPQIFQDHLTVGDIKKILGQKFWNKIFTFTVVRNPWDRCYSIYHYQKKVSLVSIDVSFSEYIKALQKATPESPWFQYHGFRFGAADYLVDDQGQIDVDYICKYENREHDLAVVASRIGIKHLGQLAIQKAAPKNSHYSEHYNPETKQIIETLYQKDIQLFDYRFENRR